MKDHASLLEQMRAATRSLLAHGPASASKAIQQALHGMRHKEPAAGSGNAAPMRDINPPPQPAPHAVNPPPTAPDASPDPAQQAPAGAHPASAFKRMMPELLARMTTGAAGAAGARAPFDLSAFELPGVVPSRPRTDIPALPGKFIDGSYSNRAGTRHYKLYIPSSYASNGGAEPMPLVVMLHGCTQDPDDFAVGTQMNALAEEMGCLVVYPAQSKQANAQRCWNWFNAVDQQRDQGEPSIIAGITRSVTQEYWLDPRRVYVAGLSAGGAMAAIMGTLYPDLYAAVGVHSGLPFASAHDLPSALAAMQGKSGAPRQNGSIVPVIVFHGDQDKTVHPANGDEVIAQRAQRANDAVHKQPGRVPDGHAYTRTVHKRADGAPLAEQWLIHGAGHAWSGGSAHGSYTDGKGPDASREMLRFFRTAP